jgi:hypothetical protein
MIAALMAAGIPRPAAREPQPTKSFVGLHAEPVPEPETGHAIDVPFALSAGSGESATPKRSRSVRGTEKVLRRAKKAKALRAQGKTRQEIANELGVVVGTVDNYLKDEYFKKLIDRYRAGSSAQ